MWALKHIRSDLVFDFWILFFFYFSSFASYEKQPLAVAPVTTSEPLCSDFFFFVSRLLKEMKPGLGPVPSEERHLNRPGIDHMHQGRQQVNVTECRGPFWTT